MIKGKQKNKETGIGRSLEFFVNQVNENFSSRVKFTIW